MVRNVSRDYSTMRSKKASGARGAVIPVPMTLTFPTIRPRSLYPPLAFPVVKPTGRKTGYGNLAIDSRNGLPASSTTFLGLREKRLLGLISFRQRQTQKAVLFNCPFHQSRRKTLYRSLFAVRIWLLYW